jgi:osmoprotectant transport system permease protein
MFSETFCTVMTPTPEKQTTTAASAAVINVGTATIGALIGAGGYGSPILTGIRLNDLGLILQGAVPAALMALAVQYGFALLEKRIVSPGLLGT